MDFNWDRIKDGETFQSLINTLIIFQDHKAKIFGRKGKDAGIDALSSDGTIVYQHKLRSTQDEIIAAAIKDLNQIKKYRKPGHKNYPLWKDIKKWYLTTNVAFNPFNFKRWRDTVVSAFKNEGFDEIKIWDKSEIEAKLINFPEIQGAFFEGENRIFFSLQEEKKILSTNEIFKYGFDTKYVGHSAEFKKVDSFIKNDTHLILPVIGSGGVGKTRFIFEAGNKTLDEGWGDVFWVNIDELEISITWFNALIPGRNTLLLLDEPENPNLLKRLFTQISLQSGNTKNWKAIIASRTFKDSVLEVLHDPKSRIIDLDNKIEINPLNETDAENFSYNILKKNHFNNLPDNTLKKISKQLSKSYDGYPIWIIYAIHLLIKEGHMANSLKDKLGLAKEYFNELIENLTTHTDKEKFKNIIQWIALYQPVNIEDINLFQFLKDQLKLNSIDEIKDVLDNLVKQRFIISRGRLREIKPDVMREHILINWLLRKKSANTGYELRHECNIIISLLLDQDNIVPNVQTIYKTLTRLELIMKFQETPVDIFIPLINQIKKIICNENVLIINKMREIASLFAPSRIIEFCEISKLIRETAKEPVSTDNPYLKGRLFHHKEIVLELPWNIFEAAQYIKEKNEANYILSEMIELVKYEGKLNEKELSYFKNDGKRASSLLPRLIIGEPEFHLRYDLLAYEKVKPYMSILKSNKQIELDDKAVLESILESLISIERMATTSEGNQFVIHRGKINQDGQEAKIRNKIKEFLWNMVENKDIPLDNKLFAWTLLEKTHVSANRSGWRNELKNDLIRVKKLIDKKGLSLEELQKAKEIWEWHLQFDKEKRPEFYQLAVDCKQIYLTYDDNKVEKFSKIFTFESDIEVIQSNAESIANDLILKQSSEEIKKFIDWYIRFAGDDKYWVGVSQVAYYLGLKIQNDSNIQNFLEDIIQDSNSTEQQLSFALAILSEWLRKLRCDNKDNKLKKILEHYISLCPSDENRYFLIVNVYNKIRPDRFGKAKDVELKVLEKYSIPIVKSDKYTTNLFNILGTMFDTDFNKIKKIIEQCFELVPPDTVRTCYLSLLDGIHFRLIFKKECPVSFGKQKVHWILNLLEKIPDLDDLGDHAEWILNDFLQFSEKLSLEWLLRFIEKRLKLNNEEPKIYSNKIIPWRFKLNKFIQIISENDKEDDAKIEIMEKLLEYNTNNKLLSYEIPDLLIDVDPEGIILPDLLLDRINQAILKKNLDKIIPWSRYAGQYKDNSNVWRKLSLPVLEFVLNNCNKEETNRLYSSLYTKVNEIESWWGAPDELHPRFQEKIDRAQKDYDKETNPAFKKYFEWCLKIAKAEKIAAEREKEEDRW